MASAMALKRAAVTASIEDASKSSVNGADAASGATGDADEGDNDAATTTRKMQMRIGCSMAEYFFAGELKNGRKGDPRAIAKD